jgi:hypothetical protein
MKEMTSSTHLWSVCPLPGEFRGAADPVLSPNSDGQRYAAYELTIAGDPNYRTPDDDAACANIRSTRSGTVGDRARQGTASRVPRVPAGVCAAELTRRRFRPSPSSTVRTDVAVPHHGVAGVARAGAPPTLRFSLAISPAADRFENDVIFLGFWCAPHDSNVRPPGFVVVARRVQPQRPMTTMMNRTNDLTSVADPPSTPVAPDERG